MVCLKFFKTFYGTTFKDNPYLEKTVLTGVSRVAKESIFSGANNFKVYTVLDDEFSDDFGITEKEMDKVIEDFEKRKIKDFQTYKKSKLIFQILYLNSSYYLSYLKLINKETEIAEYILKNSMKNKELLKLLSLEKSLVYFTTSLKSNELVMERTLRGKIIKLYEDDEDILEDAITENKQAIEMAKIYSDILNGTMEAYASIISNNLNGVMKFLTSITIVLAIPTMISSFWGMNVNLPFQDSKLGFVIMIAISAILTLVVTWWLKKKDMLD